MVWLGLHGLGIQKKMAEGRGCILKEKEAQRGRVIMKKKKPYFIKEPYGIPFELTEAGKFRQLKKIKKVV
jgi:hypothetical protein